MSSGLRQILSELLEGSGLEWGLAPLTDADAAERRQRLERWTEAGFHGTMEWIPKSLAVRADPRVEWPWARSALVVRRGHGLDPAPDLRGERPVVACYARGRDYHRVLEDYLRDLADRLKKRVPGLCTLACVDVMPIPEVDLAVRAGLGFRGRHTLLISRTAGSAANLGVLLLSEDCEPAATIPDLCGTCTACLSACPTGALTSAGLNANLCLSHWNIEDRSTTEGPAARAVRGEVLGCDLCQQACPWNRRHLREVPQPEGWPETWEGWIAAFAPGAGSGPLTKKTPLERVGRAKLRRVLLRALENVDPARAAAARERARSEETHPALLRWLEKR